VCGWMEDDISTSYPFLRSCSASFSAFSRSSRLKGSSSSDLMRPPKLCFTSHSYASSRRGAGMPTVISSFSSMSRSSMVVNFFTPHAFIASGKSSSEMRRRFAFAAFSASSNRATSNAASNCALARAEISASESLDTDTSPVCPSIASSRLCSCVFFFTFAISAFLPITADRPGLQTRSQLLPVRFQNLLQRNIKVQHLCADAMNDGDQRVVAFFILLRELVGAPQLAIADALLFHTTDHAHQRRQQRIAAARLLCICDQIAEE